MVGSGVEAPGRRDVDDRAAAGRAQVGDRRAAHEKHRVQIDVHRVEPHVVGGLLDVAARNRAGIVDQDVDAAEAAGRGQDHALAKRLLPQVAGEVVGVEVLALERGGEIGAILLAAVGEQHPRALAREQLDQRLADAADAAGDDHVLVFESHCYAPFAGMSLFGFATITPRRARANVKKSNSRAAS